MMIPAWGFGSGINTIVSNLIGKNAFKDVFPAISKTALLCFAITMGCAISLVIAPEWILRIGTDKEHIIRESVKTAWVLLVILALFSVGAIYFNGLIGTGATQAALWLQIFGIIVYLSYVFLIIKVWQPEPRLPIAWMAEAVYWFLNLVLSIWYLRGRKWQNIKV